jgi:hypothetical protein
MSVSSTLIFRLNCVRHDLPASSQMAVVIVAWLHG